jgi:hypothetical protein
MVGGLKDKPTTDDLTTFSDHIEDVMIQKNTHGKIIFYSRGRRDAGDQRLYPLNVEMNINHKYRHLREYDPTEVNRVIKGVLRKSISSSVALILSIMVIESLAQESTCQRFSSIISTGLTT